MDINNVPKICFKQGSSGEISELIKDLGDNILIVTMKELLDLDLLKPMIENLTENRMSFKVFDSVKPEPKREDFSEAIDLVRKEKFNLIIGFGGGSCIDFAKALSIGSTHQGDLWDYVNLSNKPPLAISQEKLIPIVAVPTTSGTGSEVTPYSVVINNTTQQEGTIKDTSIVPRLAVVDPLLTKDLPKDWTAITGIDAFSHALESFFNKTNRTDFSDMVAIEAMKILYHNLPLVYEDGHNLDAREKVAYGAMLAGLAISNAGTTVGHALVHPTDVRVGTPHGVSVGFYLLPVLKQTLDYEWERFSNIVHIFEETKNDLQDKDLAFRGYQLIESFLGNFKIPRKLSEYHVTQDTTEKIVDDALKYMYRPINQHEVVFNRKQLSLILQEAY